MTLKNLSKPEPKSKSRAKRLTNTTKTAKTTAKKPSIRPKTTAKKPRTNTSKGIENPLNNPILSQDRPLFDADGYYIPDPKAPLFHKLNPCHADHINALTPVQKFLELFAPECRCCAGARVFTLIIAVLFAIFLPSEPLISAVLTGVVIAVILADKLFSGPTPKETTDGDNRL